MFYFVEKFFLILITAHLLGDFVFQPDWLVKLKNRSYGVCFHALIHALITLLLLANRIACFFALAVFVAHIVIDLCKIQVLEKTKDNVWIFLGDQVLHIWTLWGITLWASYYDRYFHFSNLRVLICMLISLLILATYFSGHVIGFITRDIIRKNRLRIDGLRNGGKLIGNLERALIFFLVLFNMSSVVGLIATAKSILRFGEIKKDWKMAEYILIGTLVSFLAALICGYIARFVLIYFEPSIAKFNL